MPHALKNALKNETKSPLWCVSASPSALIPPHGPKPFPQHTRPSLQMHSSLPSSSSSSSSPSPSPSPTTIPAPPTLPPGAVSPSPGLIIPIAGINAPPVRVLPPGVGAAGVPPGGAAPPGTSFVVQPDGSIGLAPIEGGATSGVWGGKGEVMWVGVAVMCGVIALL
jgi:hypothetical protein